MISSINLYDLINYESEYCERNQSRNCSNYEQDYIFKDLYHSLKAIHYLFSKSLKESRLLNLSSRVFKNLFKFNIYITISYIRI